MGAVTEEMLQNDLKMLGLECGDMVYVHTSMKAIGWVDGGTEALIGAFLAVLGEEGTLVVPTHTLSFPGRGAAPYDSACTPTVLGAFPDAVWRHPGALRSGHGSHSSAAIGRDAAYLTENHDPTHALGKHSPLYRLWEKGGKILLLGVTHTANTTVHLGESLAKVPYLTAHYDASWGDTVYRLAPDGSVEVHRQVEFPGCSDNFEQLETLLEARGQIRLGFVGEAPSRLMSSRDLAAAVREVLAENPGALLCDKPDCPCCPTRKKML